MGYHKARQNELSIPGEGFKLVGEIAAVPPSVEEKPRESWRDDVTPDMFGNQPKKGETKPCGSTSSPEASA